MKIKEIFEYDRPRERLMGFGASSLSDAELLGILLQTGSGNDNAVDLGNRLISRFGLRGVFEAGFNELLSVKGVGKAKACKLIACFEVVKRANSGRIAERKVSCAADVAKYYMARLGALKQEHFVVVLLNSAGYVIRDYTVFVGTLDSALVHPREVFKLALKESAKSIILVHNHPSGNVEPSEEDLQFTEQIRKVSESMNVSLLDHVIVGSKGFWSWKDSI